MFSSHDDDRDRMVDVLREKIENERALLRERLVSRDEPNAVARGKRGRRRPKLSQIFKAFNFED